MVNNPIFKYVIPFIAFFFFLSNAAAHNKYNVIIDAGSSGSRVHVFETSTAILPTITEVFSEKISSSLDEFANHPQDAGANLKSILDAAVKFLDETKKSTSAVPIRVYGTAGMRLLNDRTQRQIYQSIHAYITKNYSKQFSIKDIRTISGKEEGLFDWLDVNYLSNTFKNHSLSLGVLDTGGASTQIAFETQKWSDPKNQIQLKINGKNYIVFSKSFLGLGLDESRASINNSSLAAACYPKDFELNKNISGNYNFLNCNQNYNQLLEKHNVDENVMPIKDNQVFVAFSGAYHILSFFGVDKNPKQSIVEARIKHVCSKNWEQLKIQNTAVLNKKLFAMCANGTYIYDLFFNHYQLQDNQLRVVIKINSKNIDWTLGAMFYILINQNFIDGGI